MKNYKLLFFILAFISCSTMREFKSNDNTVTAYKFRYVNLNLIIEYLTGNDTDARNIKRRKNELLQKINPVTETQSIALSDTEKKQLLEKQNQYKEELVAVKKEEDILKGKLLNEINRALEDIAHRFEVDFIFNMGEGLVYAKKEYDLTEDVLREIIRQKERSSPVTR